MQLTLKSAGQKGNVAAAHIPTAAQWCEGMGCNDGRQTLLVVWQEHTPICVSISPIFTCWWSGGNFLSWCHWRMEFLGQLECDFPWKGGREGVGFGCAMESKGAVLHHLGGEQWLQSHLPLPCAHQGQPRLQLKIAAFPNGKKDLTPFSSGRQDWTGPWAWDGAQLSRNDGDKSAFTESGDVLANLSCLHPLGNQHYRVAGAVGSLHCDLFSWVKGQPSQAPTVVVKVCFSHLI